jgi:hypothetical protein
MDQHVPEQSAAKYRSVLLEMRRDALPGLNMLYLSGLAETLAWIDRENAQEPVSRDLNVRAIVRVLRAWGDFEGDAWAGGFVLELSTAAARTLRATRTDQIGDLTPVC